MDYEEASDIYRRSIKPNLFRLDPEFAHDLAHKGIPVLKQLVTMGLIRSYQPPARLQCRLFERELAGPVGLAAGFDKNGALLNTVDALGFSFVEVGSITARPSIGNPRPRLFRLPGDEAVINFMGLNGLGAEVVAARLSEARPNLPYGVNIAKTNDPSLTGDKAVEDILFSFRAIRALNAAYVAVNVSCPNTQEEITAIGKELATVLSEIDKLNERSLPVLIKLSPDADDRLLRELLSVSSEGGVRGFICGNTSMDRSGLVNSKDELVSINRGGMSGRPLMRRALDLVRRVYVLKESNQIVIACGGISSGDDAFEFIQEGADLLQIYTSLIYQGPFAASVISCRLDEILEKHGLTLEEVRGSRIEIAG
ncbi:quinone-dependent dihydroorotate dehydrogenase [bacterium]|nr:quinone-dependent dihydroorotate dehydrogenase [bacterium]